MFWKKIFFTVVLTLIVLTDSACSGSGMLSTKVYSGAVDLMVTDVMGRQTHFSKSPEKIVIAGQEAELLASVLYLFRGAGDRLVFVEETGQNPDATAFLSWVDPAYAQKARPEENAGVAEIASLKPDLVLLKSCMADSYGASLDRLGLPVVYLDLDSPTQFDRSVGMMGDLLGQPDRAKMINAYYANKIAAYTHPLEGLPEVQKPGVLLLRATRNGGELVISIPPADGLQTRMVEMAGGRPVWMEMETATNQTTISLQQIADWAPDAIFLTSQAGEAFDLVNKLRTDPQWQRLKAVEEGGLRAFAGDFDSWDRPDPHWILGLAYLAVTLHPEKLIGLVDMQTEASQFYRNLYGMDEQKVSRVLKDLLKP